MANLPCVRRVLREDGTLWLNLGDSYVANGSGQVPQTKQHTGSGFAGPNRDGASGLAPKNLVGIPWRVAFALQADGWWLRSEIIWNKPNVMPESVLDRPTVSHEKIFLFAKSQDYYYDAAAIAEPCQSGDSDLRKMAEGKDRIDAKHFHTDATPLSKANPNTNIGKKRGVGGLRFAMGRPGPNSRMFKDRDVQHLSRSGNKERDFEGRMNHKAGSIPWEGFRRNKRTVWTVASQPFNGAHFATYPPNLIKPCILAGTKPGETVLDPFAGSGTTGQVALELGRRAILIELNPKYCDLIRQRCNVTPGLALA